MILTFDPLARLIVVPTRIKGPLGEVMAELALDTGATYSVVNEPTLNLIGYDRSMATGSQVIFTGSAQETLPEIVVDELEALGQLRPGLSLLCHQFPAGAPVDGVLGLDFFRGYRFLIDLQAGSVTLLP